MKTVTLVEQIRRSGIVLGVGTTQTLPDDEADGLIASGMAKVNDVFSPSQSPKSNGMVLFGTGSGDQLGSTLRPQDAIVSTALVSATLTSAVRKADKYGAYYEIVATGAPGSSSGFIEFELGYDQQQFQAEFVTVSAEFNPVNVMSVTAELGVLANYTTKAAQTLTIGAGSNGAFNGLNSLEFRLDGWTKTGFSADMETMSFKRIRLNFVLRQSQPAVIKIREIRAGLGSATGRICVMADDYYHSFLRRAVPVLEKRGIKSSFAIIPAAIEGFTSSATLSELQRYVASGNECVVHGPSVGSNTWFDSPYTTLADRMTEARRCRDYISANKLGSDKAANTVAYPGGKWQSGSYESDFIDALREDGFLLGRSTGTAGPNGRYFRSNYMHFRSLAKYTLPTIGHSYAGASNTANDATETTNIATLAGYMATIGAQGLDGVLLFHHIVDSGSANQTWHCEINRLIALADAVKTRTASGDTKTCLLSDFA